MKIAGPRPLVLWQIVALLSLFAYAWANMDTLGDTFWYIATGRYVLEHHASPPDELFSYTGVRGPWMVNMPISEPLFAWVSDHLGMHALLLLCTIVFALALALFWLPHTKGANARVVTWPLVLFAIYVERQDLSARSQTLAFLPLAILFICIFRLRDGKHVPRWAPFLLGALWVNIHPSFLLGVLIPLGVALALRIGPEESRPPLGPLLVFAGLLLGGGLVNPYGYELIYEFVRFMNAESTTAIDLFNSPDLQLPELVVALFIAAAAIFVCLRSPSPRGGPAEAMIMLAMIAVTCIARRYVTILVTYEIVLVGRLLGGVSWASKTPSRAAWVPLFSVPALIAAICLSEPKDAFQNMPVEAVRFIDDADLPDNVLNILHWGGYLDYQWGGRRRVFIDGRTTQFENGVLTDHTALVSLSRGAPEILDTYFINTVLWERGSPLDQALSRDPDWRLVFRKGFAVIYVRTNPLKP